MLSLRERIEGIRMSNLTNISRLPLKREIDIGLKLTILLAVLLGGMSLVGLIYPKSVYPSEALIQTYLTNDLINLILGLPILLGSLWLVRRGAWIGLLYWPGAVLYVLYNSTAYLTGMPFGLLPIFNLAIILLSAYILSTFLKGIDGEILQSELSGQVYEKIGGWVLVVFGVLFIGRAMAAIAEMIAGGSIGLVPDLGVLSADLVLSICWIFGGAALVRRRPVGYASGLGLLFAGSMLFVGLIVFLLLQPLITEAAFVLTDVIVVAVMGLVCFIPTGLYARGVLRIRK